MKTGMDIKFNTDTQAVGLLKDIRKSNTPNGVTSGGPSFAATLTEQVEKAAAHVEKNETAPSTKPLLRFSNHALERMNTRGIHFTPEQITKIEQGMLKASQKGAKETLVLTDNSALIVSLKNSTVVTVMDKSMMKENVFTNIDSTVFV